MALNVMVLESVPDGAAEATNELRDAGHTVLSCHEPGSARYGCRGVEQVSACPLRSHAVDVALVVRTHEHAQPTATEDGVRCALMHRVPLVVAGSEVMSPYDEVATRTLDRSYDVVEACEQAASDPIDALSRRATEVLGQVLGTPTPIPHAVVTRRSARLDVHVVDGESMSKAERSRAAIRIAMALRELDPFAAGIDVMLDRADERTR